MEALIVYKGKYGATRQYTQWIAEDLGLPVYTPESLELNELNRCDFVVIGSSVYMGRLLVGKWLKRNTTLLRNKKLLLYIVCRTSATEKEKQAQIVKASVPLPLLDHMDIFFLPGRLVIGKLSWTDKLFLRLGSMMEKDPVKKKSMQQDIDEVKRENIAGLEKTAGQFLERIAPAGAIEPAYHIT